ncbi:MAG: hypothetical protein ACOCW5_00205 [Spirochaetia bacterium]
MKTDRTLLFITVLTVLCAHIPLWSISIINSEGCIDLNSNGTMDRLEAVKM